jgi:phosphohistidine phosphatase
MKRLILLRHAKSSWATPGLDDHDRPLNDRGRRDAPRVGAWLAREGYLPDAALVSTAARTRATWDALGPAFAAVPVILRGDIYEAPPGTLLAALQTGAPAVACVLMLGHNPGIGSLARILLEEPPREPAFLKYPTAATAVIDLDCEAWADAAPGTGRLTAFVTPGLLDEGRQGGKTG